MIAAILLAAGSSRRFQKDKLTARYQGKPLFQHALDALSGTAEVDEVIVVIRPDFKLTSVCERIRVVENPEHEEGMSSSLRAGVQAVSEGVEAYLIALADMPGIKSALVSDLIRRYREIARTGRKILVPFFHGRKGNPVLISAELKDLLLQIKGDRGARELIREHPEWVEEFPIEDESVVRDVDCEEDLRGSHHAPENNH